MFRLTRANEGQIAAFLATQRDLTFSYAEVGCTRGAPPPGYILDHNRARLGTGRATFDRAVAALRAWRQSSLGWTSVHPRGAPTTPGTDVAVVVHHFGFWSLNACRVLYDIDDEDVELGVRRAGFAYGTLPAHGEIGEERFTVEWHSADDSVWYDLYALSRPGHPLVRLAYPLARRLQRRFARDSKQAMMMASS
ncbi:MAG TPA: DUF1990 domain-containing protein, partial [Gemmatimonadaceae bacterium]